MRRKAVVLVSVMAVAIGISLFASPSVSRADPFIHDISVTVGTTTWCGTVAAGGCDPGNPVNGINDIWSAGLVANSGGNPLGVDLAGKSLILTQTTGSATPATNNFDSSENGGGAVDGSGLACDGSPACLTTLTINGVAVALGGPGTNNLPTTTSTLLMQPTMRRGIGG